MSFFLRITASLLILLTSANLAAHDLTEVVKQVKPSIVGIGVYDPLGSPRAQLHGSGFVIGDGTVVVTNYHVVDKELAENTQQRRVVFVGSGNSPETRFANIVEYDELHDLAILKIEKPLPAMELDRRGIIPDGTEVAFTGFPIGNILGLYPATHRGLIAARTPVITPSRSAREITPKLLKRMRKPYYVYQMDATAYPGNSGSAVYELEHGRVVAIINKVFVKETKENVLSAPSGITYSIPVIYLIELLDKAGIAL